MMDEEMRAAAKNDMVAAEVDACRQSVPTGTTLVAALQAGERDDLDLPATAFRPGVRAVEV